MTKVAGLFMSLGAAVSCGGGAGMSTDGGTNTGPVYVVSTNVFGTDNITGYLSLVPSLDESVTVDLTNAIEFPGGCNAVGIEGDSSVYVGLWSSPTLERWDLQSDGSLQRGGRVSFAHLGIPDTSNVAFSPIASREKSYFPDYGGRQLVVWNPSAMEAIGTIPLPLESEGSLMPYLMSYLTLRGNHVFANSFMTDPNDWTRHSDRSRLVAIDTSTDQVVGVDAWVGCEKMQVAGQTSDGTAYYTADAQRTFLRHFLGPAYGANPCGLRVVPPEVSFDRGYDVDLARLVGGRPVAGDLTIVSDTMAFLRVWHEEDVPQAITVDNFEDYLWTARGFRWWSWEIGSASAREIPGQTPHASFTDKMIVDGRTFVVDYTLTGQDGGRGNAPLVELLPNGELRPALTAKGQVYGIVRVR